MVRKESPHPRSFKLKASQTPNTENNSLRVILTNMQIIFESVSMVMLKMMICIPYTKEDPFVSN